MIAGFRTAGAALALVTGLGAALAACTALRPETSRAAGSVAAYTRVEVDGARLYLEVRGQNAGVPLLVWLHGGPGGAERPLFRYFNGDLEQRFLVAYYDQRGAGRSFDPGASTTSLTVAQHVADLDRIVNHLRAQYRRDRILLVGHSWGAVLAMLYAQAHPAKVLGLVCAAPVVSFREQQRREYAYNLAEATRRGDRRALEELREIGPPPYPGPDPMIRLQRVTERYRGVAFTPHNRAAIALAGIVQGLVTPWEIVRIVQGMQRSLEAMHQELLAFDMRREVDNLDVPVFFFLGRHDRHVDAALAAEYFATLRAPKKEIVWFEHSAHDIPFDEPAAFGRRVIEAFAGPARFGAASQRDHGLR
jgi:pimeloyl-ACP methyl ester carboxylesterase